MRYMHTFKDPEYKDLKIEYTAKSVFKNKNMYSVFAINSLLRFFYAWMIIYAPIYLIQHVGFSVSETTFMIGLALVAFILLQTPLGYIADKILGEKEFLIGGFIILALSTASLSFITSTNFWVWTGMLFVTRIGASVVEVMSEAYFFKNIDSSDLNVIGFFRMLRPFVYTVAPLLASLLLLFIEIRFLFLILGAIILYGLRYSLILKDTR